MMKPLLCTLGLSFAAMAQGAAPIVDNEHVKVWDTAVPLPPSPPDFVAVSLSRKGTGALGYRGEVRGKTGGRTIVIELKDLPVGPLANETGYPLAFPRRHAKKLLENGQVVVWDYVWHAGDPTP